MPRKMGIIPKSQLDAIAKYLGDISKLVFAATVLGFFIQMGVQPVSLIVFLGGIIITAFTFAFSVFLVK